MRLIATDYEYQEDWQYQFIYVDLNTMNMVRRQNIEEKGHIIDTEDIIHHYHSDYQSLWSRYGAPIVIKMLKDKL